MPLQYLSVIRDTIINLFYVFFIFASYKALIALILR